MFYVYILYSQKDQGLYHGFSSDLRLRFIEHQERLIESTKNRRPVILIYYKAYLSEQNARRRELFYKTGGGRETLKKILKETLEELNNSKDDMGA